MPDDTTPVGERPRRSTFGPTVGVGLLAAGLAAVAGHRPMLQVDESYWDSLGAVAFEDGGSVEFPLAGALALVLLACWGVLLVTRGVVRRVVAGLGLLAALGIVAVLLVGRLVQADDAAEDLVTQVAGQAAATDVPIGATGWWWCAVAAALLSVAATAYAVRATPSWPEMGRRYDAPTADAPAPTDAPAADRSSLDLWKSLDEGDDPTDRPSA